MLPTLPTAAHPEWHGASYVMETHLLGPQRAHHPQEFLIPMRLPPQVRVEELAGLDLCSLGVGVLCKQNVLLLALRSLVRRGARAGAVMSPAR